MNTPLGSPGRSAFAHTTGSTCRLVAWEQGAMENRRVPVAAARTHPGRENISVGIISLLVNERRKVGRRRRLRPLLSKSGSPAP